MKSIFIFLSGSSSQCTLHCTESGHQGQPGPLAGPGRPPQVGQRCGPVSWGAGGAGGAGAGI